VYKKLGERKGWIKQNGRKSSTQGGGRIEAGVVAEQEQGHWQNRSRLYGKAI
jgi:hypothetical protein